VCISDLPRPEQTSEVAPDQAPDIVLRRIQQALAGGAARLRGPDQVLGEIAKILASAGYDTGAACERSRSLCWTRQWWDEPAAQALSTSSE